MVEAYLRVMYVGLWVYARVVLYARAVLVNHLFFQKTLMLPRGFDNENADG
jgi:hypothetical protein